MFSFIKFIQNMLRKLKSNKTVFFTTLFVLSVSGIVLSILFLTILTNRASEEVYKNQADKYKKQYNNFSIQQLGEFRKMSVLFLNDGEFMGLTSKDDLNQIKTYLENKNNTLKDTGFFNNIEIAYFSVSNSTLNNLISSVIESRNTVYGMNIMVDGVYYMYLEPVFVKDQLMGVLQFRSALNNMYNNFLNQNQEFAFLLEKNLIKNIALKYQEGNYDSFGTRYLYNNKIFNDVSLKQLSNVDAEVIDRFFATGYIINDNYYISYTKVVDINGLDIGITLFIERIDTEGSVLNVMSKITNQVIMIALGLIVSILLFMF